MALADITRATKGINSMVLLDYFVLQAEEQFLSSPLPMRHYYYLLLLVELLHTFVIFLGLWSGCISINDILGNKYLCHYHRVSLVVQRVIGVNLWIPCCQC